MKEVYITLKNFYTKIIIKKTKVKTSAQNYVELMKNLNYNSQEYLLFNEDIGAFISENNKINDKANITLFNADGQLTIKEV